MTHLKNMMLAAMFAALQLTFTGCGVENFGACAQNSDCPSGQCVGGMCTGTSQCTSNAQCSSGQVCQNGTCTGGPSYVTGGCSNGTCTLSAVSGWWIYAIAGPQAQAGCVVGQWPTVGTAQFIWADNSNTFVLLNVCTSPNGSGAPGSQCVGYWQNPTGPALERSYQTTLHAVGFTPQLDCNGNPNYFRRPQ